ncbi:hypothetical protein IX51_10730 [uncultured archaeon]|nr:hypothetical protein IX51_10730 [uncultured archaeon]
MIKYPDVQGTKPDIPMAIQKVGVKGVLYPIIIRRGEREIHLYSTIDVFVDVPASRKGADLSRTIEAIENVTDQPAKVSGVEFLAEDIAEKVLSKFPYSTRSEVHLEADYFSERSPEDGKKHMVKYRIISRSVASKDSSVTSIGIIVHGINACPCAMETTRAMTGEEFPLEGDILAKIPSITHNQRNTVTVVIQTDRAHQLEIDDLIDIAEKPVNGPLVSVLKRRDEGELVYKAHKNPKFVEDIVREVAESIAISYPDFPEDYGVEITSESDESIHPHNAFAKVHSTFGELRKSLKS